ILETRSRTTPQVDRLAGSRPDGHLADAAGAIAPGAHGRQRVLAIVDPALLLRLPAAELLEPAAAADDVPGAARTAPAAAFVAGAGRLLCGAAGDRWTGSTGARQRSGAGPERHR